jgi:hypothetical protein
LLALLGLWLSVTAVRPLRAGRLLAGVLLMAGTTGTIAWAIALGRAAGAIGDIFGY